MIVTVTLNPSLDRSIEVSALTRGAMVRATSTRLDPGGKGVNVARALAAHGERVCAVLPQGGAEGAQLTSLLLADGLDVSSVLVAGPTRSNVSLVEPDGTVTKVNEPGSPLTADDVEGLLKAALVAGAEASWVVACGSLPPGVQSDVYARLCRELSGTGARVAVDSSGAALEHAVAARPDLVKPNRDELAQQVGRSLQTLGDVREAAERVRDAGAAAVLASLGADGALLVDANGCVHGEAPVAQPRSSVGAGDAMLAGFLCAGGRGSAALASALAWGAAAVGLPGSRMPRPDDVRSAGVVLHEHPDFARTLREPHLPLD